MIVSYRVCKTRYPVFDGTDAAIAGGRWNSRGRPLIYCADSYGGSLLEILVHANAPVALPGSHHCARAFIEDDRTSPNVTHHVDAGTGPHEPKSGCSRTIWIWILVALILIGIAIVVYFYS